MYGCSGTSKETAYAGPPLIFRALGKVRTRIIRLYEFPCCPGASEFPRGRLRPLSAGRFPVGRRGRTSGKGIFFFFSRPPLPVRPYFWVGGGAIAAATSASSLPPFLRGSETEPPVLHHFPASSINILWGHLLPDPRSGKDKETCSSCASVLAFRFGGKYLSCVRI